MHDKGRGTPQDYAQAAQWYLKAADQAYAEAQENLALLYAKGLGTRPDLVQAHKWYALAALNYRPEEAKQRALAKKRYEALEAKMTAKQIADARAAAAAWRAKK
jgi:TPR repeat protein